METPCGSWRSPISSAELVRGALRLSAPRIDAGRLFWLEGRPEQGGRQVVMQASLGTDGALRQRFEASPPGVNVRTRVHEYGGGEYTVWRDRLFWVDDADRRPWSGPIGGGGGVPLAPTGSAWADLVVSPDGRWLFAIEERPRPEGEPENRLVAIPLDGSGAAGGPPRVVASGHDFYASPVCSPDGERLAWLAWDHPRMPWNGTLLEMLGWGAEGARGAPRSVAGGPAESLFQPGFAPDGTLHVATDRSGFWNLARLGDRGLEAVHTDAFEIGRPQWVFGQRTWAFVPAADAGHETTHVVAAATRDGVDGLVSIALDGGGATPIPSSFRAIGAVAAGDGFVATLAGEAGRAAAIFVWRADARGAGAPVPVHQSSALALPDDCLARAEPRRWTGQDGRTVHGFMYAPRSGGQRPRAGERPPLLVKSHGGPTAAASAALDPRIQFWTTRGFAVVDVNYAGSSGYGRSYRDSLEGAWGVADVEDCVRVARALAADGEVDGRRLAISGGSAGGYTTLCALTFHDVFAAGASHYGIGDLEALARDTHKFESRYTDWLVGPLPEARAIYHARSPIHHADRLACPVAFFQGLEDRVVPPSQAEAMVAALARRGLPYAYVPFEGEQHGFRRAENIRTALDGELYFYGRVFGFEAPRPAGVEVVEPQT